MWFFRWPTSSSEAADWCPCPRKGHLDKGRGRWKGPCLRRASTIFCDPVSSLHSAFAIDLYSLSPRLLPKKSATSTLCFSSAWMIANWTGLAEENTCRTLPISFPVAMNRSCSGFCARWPSWGECKACSYRILSLPSPLEKCHLVFSTSNLASSMSRGFYCRLSIGRWIFGSEQLKAEWPPTEQLRSFMLMTGDLDSIQWARVGKVVTIYLIYVHFGQD